MDSWRLASVVISRYAVQMSGPQAAGVAGAAGADSEEPEVEIRRVLSPTDAAHYYQSTEAPAPFQSQMRPSASVSFAETTEPINSVNAANGPSSGPGLDKAPLLQSR